MSGFKEYIKEFGFGFYFIDDFMVKVLNKLINYKGFSLP